MAQQASPNCPLDKAVKDHYKMVYRYVQRMVRNPDEAADITQNVFLNALRYNNFQGRSSIGTWLCAIAKHEVSSYYERRQRDEKELYLIQTDVLLHESETPEQMLMENERRKFAQGIRGKKGKKFEPLFLQAEDLSEETIARMLGIPKGTVKSRVYHAKQELRQRHGTEYQQY